jgi:GNAT superfamily N-acetyltransferase
LLEHRGEGLGRRLYQRFFEDARSHGRTRRAVRHLSRQPGIGRVPRALGFEAERVAHDYDGPGEDRVLFVKALA